MKNLAKRLTLAALVAAAPIAACAAPKPLAWAPLDTGVTAFVGVSVTPMDGRPALKDQVVVVRDGRIVGLGPAASTRAPAGARLIDGRGKVLIPGLIDAHAHLTPETGGSLDRQLKLSIANGITTVRALIAAPGSLAVRGRASRGEITAPTLVLAGPSFNGNSAGAPEAARALVAKAAADGFELIKTHGGQDRATYDAGVAEADRHGLPVVGHVSAGYGLARAIEAGQDVEHLDGFIAAALPAGEPAPDGQFILDAAVLAKVDPARFGEIARAMKARKICNGPTLALFKMIAGPETADQLVAARPEVVRYAPKPALAQWRTQKAEWLSEYGPGNLRFIALRDQATRVLRDEGVTLTVGGDSPHPFMVPGFSLRHEMDALVAAGLTPSETLAAATVNVARCMGETGRDIGVVAVGKRADLVLLDADAAAGLAALARPAGVMVRGKWFSRGDLDALLADVEKSAAGVS